MSDESQTGCSCLTTAAAPAPRAPEERPLGLFAAAEEAALAVLRHRGRGARRRRRSGSSCCAPRRTRPSTSSPQGRCAVKSEYFSRPPRRPRSPSALASGIAAAELVEAGVDLACSKRGGADAPAGRLRALAASRSPTWTSTPPASRRTRTCTSSCCLFGSTFATKPPPIVVTNIFVWTRPFREGGLTETIMSDLGARHSRSAEKLSTRRVGLHPLAQPPDPAAKFYPRIWVYDRTHDHVINAATVGTRSAD